MKTLLVNEVQNTPHSLEIGEVEFEDCPTTLCFCRRMGDQVRGPEYASSIERPPAHFSLRRPISFSYIAGVFALGILAAAIIL